MNIQKMMKQAQQMQSKMQEELDALVVSAQVGGGMVAVTMSGHKQLLSVKIDPEALDPEDPEMLQDLVLSAVNEANRKVDDAMKSQLGNLTGGMTGLFG